MKKTILVVEEKKRLREALAHVFDECHVVNAASAEDAIELCRSEKPALTILDLTDWAASCWIVIDSLMRRDPALQFLTLTTRTAHLQRSSSTCIIGTAVHRQFITPEMLRAVEVILTQLLPSLLPAPKPPAPGNRKSPPPSSPKTSAVIAFPGHDTGVEEEHGPRHRRSAGE